MVGQISAKTSAVICLIFLTILGPSSVQRKPMRIKSNAAATYRSAGLIRLALKLSMQPHACDINSDWCDIYMYLARKRWRHRNLVVAMLNAGTAGSPAAGTALFFNLFDSYANAVASTNPGLAGHLRAEAQPLQIAGEQCEQCRVNC